MKASFFLDHVCQVQVLASQPYSAKASFYLMLVRISSHMIVKPRLFLWHKLHIQPLEPGNFTTSNISQIMFNPHEATQHLHLSSGGW